MSVKMRLRRFVLGAAAGYNGASRRIEFARDLLACFHEDPSSRIGVEFKHTIPVVKQGKRTTRSLSAVWPERGVAMEIQDPEVMLDFA